LIVSPPCRHTFNSMKMIAELNFLNVFAACFNGVVHPFF
jgi:hypothetical protein